MCVYHLMTRPIYVAVLLGALLLLPAVPQAQAAPSCLRLAYNMGIGARGAAVLELQQTLGVQPATGYFGPLTRGAVVRWQLQHGISTTGFVGPLTRAAFGCGDVVYPPPPSTTFSVSPIAGQAPLAVVATIVVPARPADTAEICGPITVAALEWGDGSTTEFPKRLGCSGQSVVVVSHTYAAPGIYTATLSPYIACMYSNPRCMVASIPIGSVTITVGGSATTQVPSIYGLDVPASLLVGQPGVWVVRASVPNQPQTQLRYSVVWGDELVYWGVMAPQQPASIQTSATFTHTYMNPGTYTPVFTVANESGSAQTSASVWVR